MLTDNEAWEEIRRGQHRLQISMKLAPFTEYAPDNKYGMYVSPEQRATWELEKARIKQLIDANEQKAKALQQKYFHGWHDPRALQNPIMVSSTDAVYKPKRQLPKLQPFHYFLVGAAILCIIGIAYEIL